MPKKKRSAWQTTPDATAALASLRDRRIGVLSHAAEDGHPRSAVVNLTIDDEFRFYFVTQRQTEKFRDIIDRRDVALNIGFDEKRVDNFQIVGKAFVVKDVKLWASLLKAILRKNVDEVLTAGLSELTAHYPFKTFPTRDYAVVCVEPTWIRRFHHPKDAPKPVYTQILGEPVA